MERALTRGKTQHEWFASVTCQTLKLPFVVLSPTGLPHTYSASLDFQTAFLWSVSEVLGAVRR